MLFNSYIFLFTFIPILLVVLAGLSLRGMVRAGTITLLVASLIYSAWWDIRFLPLIVVSIVANHFMAKWIRRSGKSKRP